MSDDIKHEQPSEGGSYTRQPDGSLVRNKPDEAKPESKTPARPKKEGK